MGPLCVCTNTMALVVLSLLNQLELFLVLVVFLGNGYLLALQGWKIIRFKKSSPIKKLKVRSGLIQRPNQDCWYFNPHRRRIGMHKVEVAQWNALKDRVPAYALVANVDLVIVRYDDQVSVFYGRCPHRGALLSDGFVSGTNLICGVHKWDFRYDTGVSEYNDEEALPKFSSWLENRIVFVDEEEIAEWEKEHPQPFDRNAYLGLYADTGGTDAEPHNHFIQQLAKDGIVEAGASWQCCEPWAFHATSFRCGMTFSS